MKEKAKSSYTKVDTPFLPAEASSDQMTPVAGGPSKEKMEQSVSGSSPTVWPTTLGQQTTEQLEESGEVEHRSPALPTSMPNGDTTVFDPNARGGPPGSEPEQYTTTIHIHLDQYWPNLTEPYRCLLDTGSDFNLVSQEALRRLSIPFNERKTPAMTLLGGVQFLPIGSVRLSWHMDKHKQVTYNDEFYVLSDSTKPFFDVLLGKDWIRRHKALLRNPEVLLVRHLGPHNVLSSMSGGAET